MTPNIQVIVTASDGKEALELLETYRPDVITLDVEMPRLDGLSTRRNNGSSSMPSHVE